MPHRGLQFSLPRWRVTQWLAHPGTDASEDIRRALVGSLYGTLPIYIGGILNTIAVAALIAWRMPSTPFLLWLGVEIIVCVWRLAVLLLAFRRARQGRETPTDMYIVLGVCWAATVGYGAFVSVVSGDWVAATLACMSAAAMVGGTCFRNFGAPRLSAVMTALSLGPACLAAPFSGEPVMLVAFFQIPMYLYSMRLAAYRLNALLIKTMMDERESDKRATEDPLTGLSNRSGFSRAMDVGRGEELALLYLDLDGFKAVNDIHGHAAGDRLLQQAAGRLRRMLRAGDAAARIGGDEFVVVARGVARGQAQAFGERIIRELSHPYELGVVSDVAIGVSVGVALTPDHGDALADLLDVADSALYSAKGLGKSRCVVAHGSAGRRSEPERALAHA